MQLSWLWRGLRTGIRTTRYPASPERMPHGWRGVVTLDPGRCVPESALPPCAEACLPGALVVDGDRVRLVDLACVACGLCVAACPEGALTMTPQFELARREPTRTGG